jgi:hypothetical protein
VSGAVRWTVKVSKETARTPRSFLGAQGMKKGDLSRYVEEAVRWRVLDHTVRAIEDRNQDLAPEDLDAAIEEALREVRPEKSAGA